MRPCKSHCSFTLAFSILHNKGIGFAGVPRENETFAGTLESVPDLVETAQTQLSKGASTAIALLTMEMAIRNIRGAVYVYNNDNAAAYAEGVAEARLILKVRPVHHLYSCKPLRRFKVGKLNCQCFRGKIHAQLILVQDVKTFADSCQNNHNLSSLSNLLFKL